MRGVGGVLGAMSLERAEPFWTHLRAYKLKKGLEMGNFGTGSEQRGGAGGIGEGCGRSVGQYVFRASKASEEGVRGWSQGQVAGTFVGIP